MAMSEKAVFLLRQGFGPINRIEYTPVFLCVMCVDRWPASS